LGHYLIMGCTFMGAVAESHWLVYWFGWLWFNDSRLV